MFTATDAATKLRQPSRRSKPNCSCHVSHNTVRNLPSSSTSHLSVKARDFGSISRPRRTRGRHRCLARVRPILGVRVS